MEIRGEKAIQWKQRDRERERDREGEREEGRE